MMREKKAVLLYSQALCQQFIQNVKHCWNKGIRCSKFYLDDLKTVEEVWDTTDQQPDRLLTLEYPPPPYFISWRYKNYSLDRPKNARYPHCGTTNFCELKIMLFAYKLCIRHHSILWLASWTIAYNIWRSCSIPLVLISLADPHNSWTLVAYNINNFTVTLIRSTYPVLMKKASLGKSKAHSYKPCIPRVSNIHTAPNIKKYLK